MMKAHKQKNMLCFFDTARITEDECRDARVEDVRTSVHMAPCSHERPFVCFSLSSSLLFLLTLPFFIPSWFFEKGEPLLIDRSATVLSNSGVQRGSPQPHNHSVQERDCDYSYGHIRFRWFVTPFMGVFYGADTVVCFQEVFMYITGGARC
jgi:hypothetical protein